MQCEQPGYFIGHREAQVAWADSGDLEWSDVGETETLDERHSMERG